MHWFSTKWIGIGLVVILLSGGLADGAGSAPWQDLFDGSTLTGWVQRGGKALYKVENGAIVGMTVPNTPNSFLCTEKTFGDFILELDFQVDPELNSGVQIRSNSLPEYQEGRVHGYQVEIDPSGRAWTGGIYDESRRGWLFDLKENEKARKAFKQGEWNHFRIEAVGESIQTWLNDVPAASLKDSMTPSGFIALQVHATQSEHPLQVRWKNIRLQDLSQPGSLAPAADPFVGDWQGREVNTSSGIVAQVIALGTGEYQANLLPEFDKRGSPITVMNGAEIDGKVAFSTGNWWGGIEGDRFTGGKQGDEPWSFEMKKVTRLSPTLGAKPPADAVVLFDGTSLDAWETDDGKPAGWKIIESGAMEVVPRSGSLVTKEGFADFKLHLEFRTPFLPEQRGQGRGNSGVYLQGRYEVQVLDSYGLEGRDNECGGIYKVAWPRVNMCAPPLQWQTYDITFRAPRFDEDGRKVSNARVTVAHNGVTIHEELEIPNPTGGAKEKGESGQPGPVCLQDHGDRVAYRNIWIVPL